MRRQIEFSFCAPWWNHLSVVQEDWFFTFARIFDAVTSGVIMTLSIEHHTEGKVTSLVNERGLIGFAISKSFAYWDEWGRAGRSKLVFPLTHSTINILGELRDKTANENKYWDIDWWVSARMVTGAEKGKRDMSFNSYERPDDFWLLWQSRVETALTLGKTDRRESPFPAELHANEEEKTEHWERLKSIFAPRRCFVVKLPSLFNNQ